MSEVQSCQARNLDRFRPLIARPGHPDNKRLTDLTELTFVISRWTRYRSRNEIPDSGDTFWPAIPGLLNMQVSGNFRRTKDVADHKGRLYIVRCLDVFRW